VNAFDALIEATAVPVAAARTRAADGAPWVRIAVDVPHQAQTLWCWCAVAVGVHRFFEPGFAAEQCQAASTILQAGDACAAPASPDFNKTFKLSVALERLGNLDPPVVEDAIASIAFNDVRAQIDRGRPMCARVEWPDRRGHFVVIEGYRPGPQPMVAVHDPDDPGELSIDFEALRSAYRGDGTWTHAYRTRSHLG
jgi:Papain-like cysteine protease AvrRpt2